MRVDEPAVTEQQRKLYAICPTCVGMNRPRSWTGQSRHSICSTCVGMKRTCSLSRSVMPEHYALSVFAKGEMVELTPELKVVFENWRTLTLEQKDTALAMMKASTMINKRERSNPRRLHFLRSLTMFFIHLPTNTDYRIVSYLVLSGVMRKIVHKHR